MSKHVKHLTHAEMKYRFQRLICSSPLFNIRMGVYDRGKTVILKHCHYLDIEYYQIGRKTNGHGIFVSYLRNVSNEIARWRNTRKVEENLCMLFVFMMVFDIRKLFSFLFANFLLDSFLPVI